MRSLTSVIHGLAHVGPMLILLCSCGLHHAHCV
jgi:hypothetical protein